LKEYKTDKFLLAMDKMTTITNVYDNVLYNKNLKYGWGFSCYIEHKDKKILFDTGNDSYTLFYNMEKIGINAELLDFLIVSHNHWDHTGGLIAAAKACKHSLTYVGASFSKKFIEEISGENNECKTVADIVYLCNKNILIGPELSNNGLKEIAVALKHEKGLIIITGCAHPGIINIIKELKKKCPENIYLVLGGFHLYDKPLAQIKDIVTEFKELGVCKVAPCHCTGEKAIELFREEYENNFIDFHTGSTMKIE